MVDHEPNRKTIHEFINKHRGTGTGSPHDIVQRVLEDPAFQFHYRS